MADLYTRLTEIEGMTRILTEDVGRLAPILGDRSIQSAVSEDEYATRRSYVRAVFALIEATIEQHKRLLLDLFENNYVNLDKGVGVALTELIYVVGNNGTVKARDQYLQLERKIKAVYRAASGAFGEEIHNVFGNQGWQAFQSAIKIRDRITHPKNYIDCHIEGEELNEVDQGHGWFRNLSNEFVRIARVHRESHHW